MHIYFAIIFNLTEERSTMYKSIAILLSVAVLSLVITGCSTPIPMGYFHTNSVLPALVVSQDKLPKEMKKGTSEVVSYFAVVSLGDASIDKAVKNGNLSKIYYVDWQITNPWGIGLKTVYTTTVYGE